MKALKNIIEYFIVELFFFFSYGKLSLWVIKILQKFEFFKELKLIHNHLLIDSNR